MYPFIRCFIDIFTDPSQNLYALDIVVRSLRFRCIVFENIIIEMPDANEFRQMFILNQTVLNRS